MKRHLMANVLKYILSKTIKKKSIRLKFFFSPLVLDFQRVVRHFYYLLLMALFKCFVYVFSLSFILSFFSSSVMKIECIFVEVTLFCYCAFTACVRVSVHAFHSSSHLLFLKMILRIYKASLKLDACKPKEYNCLQNLFKVGK